MYSLSKLKRLIKHCIKYLVLFGLFLTNEIIEHQNHSYIRLYMKLRININRNPNEFR